MQKVASRMHCHRHRRWGHIPQQSLCTTYKLNTRYDYSSTCLINVPTPFNTELPAIGGHLSKADSHLLVVRTCYNGQCKQILRFRRSFQPKIAGAHPNLRSTVGSIFSVLPSGDQFLRDEPHDSGKSTLAPIGYVRFTTSRCKSHVFCFQPAMSKKRTILSLDQ